MFLPMTLPILWVAWAVGPFPLGAAGTLIRLGTRVLVWGHDPAALVPGGGPVRASIGLGVALLVVLGAWAVVVGHAGLRQIRRTRKTGRARHRHRIGTRREWGRVTRDGGD
jgi:hypothetical protein